MTRLSVLAQRRTALGLIAAGLSLIAPVFGLVDCSYARGYAKVAPQADPALRRCNGVVQLQPAPAIPRCNIPMPGQTTDILAQNGNGDDVEVSPADIEKYVAVYKAMQRDHALRVDQAARQQGLTLQAFRDLESRVERDDAALQRARDELQGSALQVSPAGRATSSAPAQ